jgi:hypothetical protein
MPKAPVTVASQRSLTCARCGAAFSCGAGTDHCWCFDESYRVPMPAPDGADCLCPACLRAQARKTEVSAPR